MSTPKKSKAPADSLELYEKLVATNPDVERKGAANPYTSLNGHMFSYLHPSGSMALRLPEGKREAFLKKYKTTLFEAYGVVQKRIRDCSCQPVTKHEGTGEVFRGE